MRFMVLDWLAFAISVIAAAFAAFSTYYASRSAKAAAAQADEARRANDFVAQRMQQEAARFQVALVRGRYHRAQVRVTNEGAAPVYIHKAFLKRGRVTCEILFSNFGEPLQPGTPRDATVFADDFSVTKPCQIELKWSLERSSKESLSWKAEIAGLEDASRDSHGSPDSQQLR